MTTLTVHPLLQVIDQFGDGYAAKYLALKFMVTEGRALDGKMWLHASVSRLDGKMPSYDDLALLKKLCIGEHRTALQVFPPSDKHVNWAGERGMEVLHLWCCLDGDVTPDFTKGRSMI